MSNFEKTMESITARENMEMNNNEEKKESQNNKEGIEMKKYVVFKMDKKVVEAIKQQRKEAKTANRIADYKDEEHRRLLSGFRGDYVPPRGHVFANEHGGNREEKENALRLFKKVAEGKVFEKTGDDYWHTEYRAEICNEAGESEVVRVVRHKVAAAMHSFTAYDIFLGNKRLDIDGFDWDELAGQMK